MIDARCIMFRHSLGPFVEGSCAGLRRRRQRIRDVRYHCQLYRRSHATPDSVANKFVSSPGEKSPLSLIELSILSERASPAEVQYRLDQLFGAAKNPQGKRPLLEHAQGLVNWYLPARRLSAIRTNTWEFALVPDELLNRRVSRPT